MASYARISDVGTKLQITIKDQDGTVVDLSSCTAKQIKFVKGDGSTATEDLTFLTDGTDGRVYYTFDSDDINISGVWKYQAIITYATGVWHSNIGRITVKPNL